MTEKNTYQEIPGNYKFHSCVMTSFTFDFHHFESQVLRVLRLKGISNVIVLTDMRMLEETISYTTGNIKSATSDYSVNSILRKGAFHPKLTFLAGDEQALVLYGSGNITPGGSGKNHELFSGFYAETRKSHQLPLIQETWQYLKDNTNHLKGYSSEMIKQIESNCTLLTEPDFKKHQFHKVDEQLDIALLYNTESSIFEQITSLLDANEVDEINIFSPFYDTDGTLIKSLKSFFKNSNISVYIDEQYGNHPEQIENINDVTFHLWSVTPRSSNHFKNYHRKLHSKIFHFKAGDKEYCLIGSPNATEAAIGSQKRPINEEFAVLMKAKNFDFLSHLDLKGNPEAIDLSDYKNPSKDMDFDDIFRRNNRSIKILGADRFERNIALYLDQNIREEDYKIKFYNTWGELMHTQNKFEIDKDFTVRFHILETNIAFLQIEDLQGYSCSNKQMINIVHELIAKNPSPENVKLNRLIYRAEMGSQGVFDIINFFNDIQQMEDKRRTESKKTFRQSANNENSVDHISSPKISYEEAIELSELEGNENLISNHGNHGAIRMFDAIERYVRKKAEDKEIQDQDDEEEGDIEKGKDKDEDTRPIEPVRVKNKNGLDERRKRIQRFVSNYLKLVRKKKEKEDYHLDMIDMAMFLIVIRQILTLVDRKIEITSKAKIDHKEIKKQEVKSILPVLGKPNSYVNFKGILLNAFGEFLNLVIKAKSFHQYENDYLNNKQDVYKNQLIIDVLFCLSALKQKIKSPSDKDVEWINLMAFNLFEFLGFPEGNIKSEFETLFNESSLEEFNVQKGISFIEQITKEYKTQFWKKDCYVDSNLGICKIKKTIPKSGMPKFLKVIRPGFSYDEEEKDFVLEELVDINTGELIKSLQKSKENS